MNGEVKFFWGGWGHLRCEWRSEVFEKIQLFLFIFLGGGGGGGVGSGAGGRVAGSGWM